MAHRYATGTLLLLGVVFLSLNAFAVSARPGELPTAEKTLATSSVVAATASAPGEPAGGRVAVPVPPPTLDPVMATAGRMTMVQPTLIAYPDPSAGPGQGINPPSAAVQGIAGPAPGQGIYPPSVSPAVAPLWSTQMGTVAPAIEPTPAPPITPSPGRMSPGPTPPCGVEPAHEGL